VIQALAITLAPSGTSGAHPAEQPQHQFVYQLKGKLTLFMAEQRIELKAGDAVTIPAGTPHRWQNENRRPAQLLLVLSPTR
jgi:quercetin dioxygenase-like cupin family protein